MESSAPTEEAARLPAPAEMQAPTPIKSKTKWAEPGDWDKYRNTITALFMCHSVSNVARIMREEHQFFATDKMFKNHINRKWGLRKGRSQAAQDTAGKVHKRKPRDLLIDSERPAAHREYLPQEDSTYISQSIIESPTAGHPEGLMQIDLPRSQRPGSMSRGSPPLSLTAIGDRQVMFQDTGPISTSAAHLDQIQSGWVDFPDSSRPALPSAPHLRVHDVARSDADTFATATAVGHKSPESRPFDVQVLVSEAPDSPTGGSWMSTADVRSGSPSTIAPSSSASRAMSGKSRASKSSSGSLSTHRTSSRGTLSSSASGSRRHTSRSSSRQSTMTLPPASIRHLTAPDGLLFPEKSMFFARHYISSAFSTGLWTLSQTSDTPLLDTECIKLDEWFNDFNPALEFLYTRRVKKAFRVFQRCFAATKDIIVRQDPRIVIYICQQAIRLILYDNFGRNLARVFLKYTADICKDLFTMNHPLSIILQQMAQMDHFEFAQSIRSLMECYFDHLEPFLDQTSDAFGFIIDLRGLTISLMEACKIVGMYDSKPVIDQLVQKAQRLNHSTLQLRIELASMYQRSRLFGEARAILEEIIDSAEARIWPYQRAYAYIMLMVTLRGMGVEIDSIIRVGYSLLDFLSQPMEFANDFNRKLFESQAHSTLVMALGKLEKDLRDNGRFEEADKILVRLNATMNENYGTEEPTDNP